MDNTILLLILIAGVFIDIYSNLWSLGIGDKKTALAQLLLASLMIFGPITYYLSQKAYNSSIGMGVVFVGLTSLRISSFININFENRNRFLVRILKGFGLISGVLGIVYAFINFPH